MSNRKKIKSFLDQLLEKYQPENDNRVVHKTRHGFIELRPLPKEMAKSKFQNVRRSDRSRSRSVTTMKSRQSKAISMKQRKDTKVREPAPIVPQEKLNLSNYCPLTTEQLDLKGRWMANEDLNIWMYVKDFGAAHHKRQEFWDQGYENCLWRKNKSVSSVRQREKNYVCHLTKKDIKQIQSYIKEKQGKNYFNNFVTAGQDVRKLVSITHDTPDAKAQYLLKNVQPKSDSLFYSPNERIQYLINKREPRYPRYSTSDWFKISKGYWNDWAKARSDQREWINFNQEMQESGELWREPSNRLSIQTNFQGDRQISRLQKPGEQDNERTHDKFLKGLQKDFGIPPKQLQDLFSRLTYTRSDLIEYLESQGQKNQLLWQKEEDETLIKHYRNPNHHLMKLITRLKGPERIERRLKFLKVM